MPRPRRRVLRPLVDALDDRCLLSGMSPAQITQAYGLNAITFTNSNGTYLGNGTGETIALVETFHDPYLATDLKTFDQAEGLADPPSLDVINNAGDQTDDGWASEETLDVEWAHAIAPGANILVVEAASESKQDLLHAVDIARNTPGVVAISMSWGFGEFQGESEYDTYFTTPAGHAGITFIAASGDSGQAAGASWPAASSNVLSVGGTTLFVDDSGLASGETTWSDSQGGLSQFEAEPSYQESVQTSGYRSTPDVSFDANPRTGVTVYTTSPSTGVGSFQTVGGTSLGSPAWAAIIAIVDEGRAIAGEGSLDGATQTLPTLYSIASTDYNTVSSNTTSSGGTSGGGFGGFPNYPFGGFPFATAAESTTTSAATTTNTATGLGTPNGPSLINDLVINAKTVGTSDTDSSSSSSSSTTIITTTTTTTGMTGTKGHKKKVVVRHPKVKPKVAAKKTKAAKKAVVGQDLADLIDAALEEMNG